MLRVDVKPQVMRWACERAGLEPGVLAHRLPFLPAWERGEKQPTLKQLESFARAVRVPIGFLFLPEPPVETVPIPDFRTIGGKRVGRPSPELLDTVYLCQRRQDWYHDFARSVGDELLEFVGSVRITDSVVQTAARMRQALAFDLEARRSMPTWSDALRHFIRQAEALGVLVMVSGVVGSNTARKLEPAEFRGFALADDLAPLVFVNGADTKAAQLFTLAHELAHVWLGQSALSDSQAVSAPGQHVERWCNQVAAELLVPLDVIRTELNRHAIVLDETARLARRFKVSTLVILRRLHDLGHLTGDDYREAYAREAGRAQRRAKGGGGDFYLTLGARVSKRFARAMVESTLEGRSSFTEAFRLLGFKKMATFDELARSFGMDFR